VRTQTEGESRVSRFPVLREKSVRVLLADGHVKVRAALRLLLEQEPGLTVVGEAATARDLFAQVRRIRPDLVLLDWELPGLQAIHPSPEPGEPVLPALRYLCRPLKVIALSGHLEACEEALAAGADAFVSKGDPPERLIAALRMANVGAER
jgi:DNA-binding NarL/FixJ family response regulator